MGPAMRRKIVSRCLHKREDDVLKTNDSGLPFPCSRGVLMSIWITIAHKELVNQPAQTLRHAPGGNTAHANDRAKGIP